MDETLPPTMIAKMRLEDDREFAGRLALGGAHREVGFYRDFQPLPPSVPRCYLAAEDPVTGTFILLLEDLGDGKTLRDRAEQSVCDAYQLGQQAMQAIAEVHAQWINLPEKPAYDWLSSDNYERLKAEHISRLAPMVEHFATLDTYKRLPAAMQSFIHDRVANYEAGTDIALQTPLTLVHGDFWPGQVLLTGDAQRPLCIIDWEFVRIDLGLMDVARMHQDILGIGVPYDRGAELTSAYLDELANRGVPAWDSEQVANDMPICFASILEQRVWCVTDGQIDELAMAPYFDALVQAFAEYDVVKRVSQQLGW